VVTRGLWPACAPGHAPPGAAEPAGLAPVTPVPSRAKTGRVLLKRWVIGALLALLPIAFPHSPSPVDSAAPTVAGSGVPYQGIVEGSAAPAAAAAPLGLLAAGTGPGEVIDRSLRTSATVHRTSLWEAKPLLLTLPSARLDQGTVEAVDVNDQGRLVPPDSAVGWYRNEAGLGRPGSALFVAHIAYNGKNGPFRKLDAVRVGDEATVGLTDGSSYTYVVNSITVHRKQEVPFDTLAGGTGPDRIALGTCTGSFDKKSRSYDSNLVIVAARHQQAGGRPG